MLGSAVLEVAIGLVLVYLMLSLVCSSINEFIGRLLNWRANTLKAGIASMLDDLKDSDGQPVGSKFYENPLIRGLIGKGKAWTRNNIDPTYIPSRAFAQALLNHLAPSYKDVPQTFDTVRRAVGNLPDSDMKTSLLGLLDSAQ